MDNHNQPVCHRPHWTSGAATLPDRRAVFPDRRHCELLGRSPPEQVGVSTGEQNKGEGKVAVKGRSCRRAPFPKPRSVSAVLKPSSTVSSRTSATAQVSDEIRDRSSIDCSNDSCSVVIAVFDFTLSGNKMLGRGSDA